MEENDWFEDYLKNGHDYKPHTDEGRYWKYSHKMVSKNCRELKAEINVLSRKISK